MPTVSAWGVVHASPDPQISPIPSRTLLSVICVLELTSALGTICLSVSLFTFALKSLREPHSVVFTHNMGQENTVSLYESKINSNTDPENPFFSPQSEGSTEKGLG